MRTPTRIRTVSAALAVAAASITFTTAGTGSAHAAGCPANGQVLGAIQSIKVGSQTIGQFYLGWNCSGAYTEVNLWNTNYVNNWRFGQVDVKSSSHYAVNSNKPVLNNGSYWFDAGYIPVTGVSNTREYKGNWNFTAYGHSCSGQTTTWNFSYGGPSNTDNSPYSNCS
ncbi:hypothetical protein J7W19_00635 [Streptomyces mobaraensis NBRC 13819 = DSM 40847]|uniref:Uncharacterized protein n=1 Tax=Streptomyces mobaraensis (strain ATCC 29032 / DSM 40847 / JCM 4168 / NBRC 13819 / NCIMB 11159 / IPCR 16-22) TaxID=1223523 RepID=M3CC06_STRM1|nr:hypothetical protein [Streptomyces mobaraensis]EMF01511.1 hypothetical protein H340_05726 [Streptomyces mobaraensis NBRC 13819 = DSM 40847]QTT72135.1 hypothetical protein J7W19_00635 [Streptomyces mobaraensis NBRC 13819 = DSM 40847]